MRVAIYARVSTTVQDTGLQTSDLRQFAEARGWQIAGEYVDAGVSGAKDSRPELSRLMSEGLSWRTIERELGISVRTARRFAEVRGKKVSVGAPATPTNSATA